MNKISITLDVSKISKTKIIDRKYTNKENTEVIVKEYKIDVVPVKEVKVVAQGDTWIMKKTHFVVEAQTKEERADKTPSVYVGEGFSFESREVVTPQSTPKSQSSNLDNFSAPEIGRAHV